MGLSFETMMSVERISSPEVSPDGKYAVYMVTTPDLERNKTQSRLELIDLETGSSSNLTPGPGSHSQPAWSPDGSKLAFVSNRKDDAGSQLWVLPVSGGEARQVTRGYGGANSPVWAPDSKRIAFSRTVVVSEHHQPKRGQEVDPKNGPTTAEVYGLSHPRSSARIANGLLFRHWDAWRHHRRNHVHIVDTRTSKVTDVTPFDCDSPPISLGSDHDFAFSPKGDEIAFVMNPDGVVARSTNNSIFLQRLAGVRLLGDPVCISTTDACDCHPRYTPDGSAVLYLGMSVPGYEADKNRIKAYDRKTKETLTHLETFDRSPSQFHFESDTTVLFLAEDRGRQSVYRFDLGTKKIRQLTDGSYNGTVRPIPGRKELLVTRETTTQPADLHLLTPGDIAPKTGKGSRHRNSDPVDAGASVTRLTESRKAVAKVNLRPAEDFWFDGAGDHPVHGLLIKPERFDPKKKYPLILLIHGGPQGAFADHFHYRWNAQHFASEGAVVAMINPRGSTGYGQKFTDQISRDWGGRCYDDLMRGVDYLLAEYRFLDRKRMAAAGASFGGFMVNWIAGHSDRFRALVSHDGIFNAETMAYTTEELWFDEHENGGMPHENRKPFLKQSPHLHVANFKTPTLVIQGQLDYRCPESEGIGMFQALQVMGVESRLLYFPDEGHWVMQPANSQVWYGEVLGWMMKYLR